MLTADLVNARRRGDRLQLVPLDEGALARGLLLAATYLDLARAHVGATRGALVEACKDIPVSGPDDRMARGLQKLVMDRCTFEEGAGLDPAELRRELFTRAAAARRMTPGGLDRAALVATLAREREITPEALERSLFADLPDAHQLMAFADCSAALLLSGYETAQVKAVLLRAVKVTVTVRGASPLAFRDLFRKLKFLRLLHTIEPLPRKAGYRIDIDGPFSLFDAVTKYGVQLATAFPVLAACGSWDLDADLRWGPEKLPLRFHVEGDARADDAQTPAQLPDEVRALLEQLGTLKTPWRASVAATVIDLPGVGLCVPDLVFRKAGAQGPTVLLEVLGFWSRDAVWRRVELAQRGLPTPVVFAVSKNLRVSEAALDAELPSLLYVYSRTMNARAVLERVEEAARRAEAPPLQL